MANVLRGTVLVLDTPDAGGGYVSDGTGYINSTQMINQIVWEKMNAGDHVDLTDGAGHSIFTREAVDQQDVVTSFGTGYQFAHGGLKLPTLEGGSILYVYLS